jgi:hypothetical protein
VEEKIANWEYDDFLHFLLIHAASSDLNISDDEKKLIIETATEDKYHELLEFYQNNSDFENMLILHEFKDKYLNSPDKIDEVFTKVEDLFYADGEFSINEKNLNIALRMIFE